MNSVHLIGNLATDVELRDVEPKEEAEQKKVASFLLAVDRGSRDGGADFVWVTAWDRQAELCAEYLSKGGRVAVDGRLKSRTWEQDGRRRDAVEVVARRVEFLTRPSGEPSDESSGGEVIPFEAATA
jgi:single-strand DNA-binding protein